MDKQPRLPRPRSIVECFEGFTDMEFLGRAQMEWFKTFLELPNGIPSHDTFNRVFSAIDPHRFLDGFAQWAQGVCGALKDEVVAIDGKALRRAANDGEALPCVVSAFATENGLTLGQVKVDDKSNEITAIPKLLDMLALKGCIVTLDAMGCQKNVAGLIVDKEADYVLALKGNQGVAHAEFKEYFDHAVPAGTTGRPVNRIAKPGTMDFFESIEKGHGRLEERRYWQTTDIDWFQDKKQWKGLASAGMVESIRTVKGKRSVERRYYLSSLRLGANTFAKAVRQHWGVENTLHWSLDVTFGEDQSRARTRYGAQNLATLRRLALNLLKNDKTKNLPIRRKRMLAAINHEYLKGLLGI